MHLTTITTCIAFSVITAAQESNPPAITPLAPVRIHNLVNSLSRKHDHYRNDAQKAIFLNAFREDIATNLDNQQVKFRVELTKVTWKDGFATLSTTSELPERTSAVIRGAYLTRRTAFKIPLSELQAAGLKPGMPVALEGRIRFTNYRANILSKAPAPIEYSIHSARWTTSGVSSFILSEYSLTIGDHLFRYELPADSATRKEYATGRAK